MVVIDLNHRTTDVGAGFKPARARIENMEQVPSGWRIWDTVMAMIFRPYVYRLSVTSC